MNVYRSYSEIPQENKRQDKIRTFAETAAPYPPSPLQEHTFRLSVYGGAEPAISSQAGEQDGMRDDSGLAQQMINRLPFALKPTGEWAYDPVRLSEAQASCPRLQGSETPSPLPRVEQENGNPERAAAPSPPVGVLPGSEHNTGVQRLQVSKEKVRMILFVPLIPLYFKPVTISEFLSYLTINSMPHPLPFWLKPF